MCPRANLDVKICVVKSIGSRCNILVVGFALDIPELTAMWHRTCRNSQGQSVSHKSLERRMPLDVTFMDFEVTSNLF